MTRQKQMEEAAKTEFPWSLPQIRDAFTAGAEWADYTNHDSIEIAHLRLEIVKLRTALNRIGIAQMGELDYTQDFFELTKQIVREALK